MKRRMHLNSSVLVMLVLLACATGYLVTGYLTLGAESRGVPIFTAYATIFLLLLGIARQLFPRRGEKSEEPTDELASVSLRRELQGLLYIVSFLLGIYLVGFYIAAPVYLFASIAFLGKQSMKSAGLATIFTTVAIYVTFGLILEYPLFAGVLLF